MNTREAEAGVNAPTFFVCENGLARPFVIWISMEMTKRENVMPIEKNRK